MQMRYVKWKEPGKVDIKESKKQIALHCKLNSFNIYQSSALGK